MKRSALALFTIVMLSGCSKPVTETNAENDSPPVANATGAAEASSIDAAILLASTLENAKAENKRVMAHLGAPG